MSEDTAAIAMPIQDQEVLVICSAIPGPSQSRRLARVSISSSCETTNIPTNSAPAGLARST